MKRVRKRAKPVSFLLTILMLFLVMPCRPATASMIGTETVLELTRSEEARCYLDRILTSEDVQTALRAQGIDPLEAKARVDSLSNAEVVRLAGQLERLPAGGTMGSIFGITLLITFLVVVGLAVWSGLDALGFL